MFAVFWGQYLKKLGLEICISFSSIIDKYCLNWGAFLPKIGTFPLIFNRNKSLQGVQWFKEIYNWAILPFLTLLTPISYLDKQYSYIDNISFMQISFCSAHREFAKSFEFAGKGVDEALRQFQSYFKLTVRSLVIYVIVNC